MKTLKKLLCLTACILTIAALSACADQTPALNNPTILQPTITADPREEDTVTEPTITEPTVTEPTVTEPTITEPTVTEPPVTEPEISIPVTEKYESSALVPYGDTALMKDQFLCFADDSQTMFWTKDGQLLNSVTLEDSFWFADKTNVAQVVSVWNDVAYMDNKGFLYICCGNDIYPCQNIKGQIIWYFEDMFSGDLCILSRDEEGYLYYNAIDSTGIKEKHDNAPLSLYDSWTKTRYDRVDTIRFVQDGSQPNVYVEVDGMAIYCNVTGVDFFTGEAQLWISGAYATKAENVMAYGYGGVTSHLYKVDGDNSALYYRYGYKGTELPIYMPEGKTVDQLTQVIFGSTTLLLFQDGSVYTCQLEHTIVGPEMVLDEVLTQLNRDGAIKQIFQSTYLANRDCQLRILMEDNVTYIYTPENG